MPRPRPRIVAWLLPVAARAPLSLLLALLLVGFADEWLTFFPAGLLSPIQADLGLSYTEAGLLLLSLSAGGIAGLGVQIAADFVSRRLMTSAGALLYGLCLLAFALTDSFLMLVTAGLLWGLASDALTTGCDVTLVDLYGDDLAPVLGRVNALSSVGDLLAPLTLAAASALGLHWHAVFALGGGAMLLYAAWLGLQRFPPPRTEEEDEPKTPLRSVLAVLRDRRVLVLAGAVGLFALLDEPFWGFLLAHFEHTRGISPAAGTLVVSVGVAAGVAGYLAVAPLSRRASTRELLLVGAGALTLGTAGLVFLPSLVLVLPAALLFGVAGAVFYAVLEAAYLTLRPGQAGATSAVVSAVGLLGTGFPLLAGYVADIAGLSAGLLLYVAAAVLLLPLVYLGGAASTQEDTERRDD